MKRENLIENVYSTQRRNERQQMWKGTKVIQKHSVIPGVVAGLGYHICWWVGQTSFSRNQKWITPDYLLSSLWPALCMCAQHTHKLTQEHTNAYTQIHLPYKYKTTDLACQSVWEFKRKNPSLLQPVIRRQLQANLKNTSFPLRQPVYTS